MWKGRTNAALAPRTLKGKLGDRTAVQAKAPYPIRKKNLKTRGIRIGKRERKRGGGRERRERERVKKAKRY